MPSRSRGAAHRPFQVLKELVDRGEVRLSPETDKHLPPPRKVDDSLSDEAAFFQAMEEVRPLGWNHAPLRLPRAVELKQGADDEIEALARLTEFIRGGGELDPFATGEALEGATSRRARAYLGRLRRGEFSVQAHLDLHGLDTCEARQRVSEFIREAAWQGFGCVRIVHGRGKHSHTEPAALKTQVSRWLTSRQMRRFVIAFASARWLDGGGGAVYVLLYRKYQPRKS